MIPLKTLLSRGIFNPMRTTALDSIAALTFE